MLSVVGAYEFAGGGLQFCAEHFVRPKVGLGSRFRGLVNSHIVQAMEEIHKLRAQICNIVNATFPGVETGLGQPLKPPSETQVSCSLHYQLALR